MTSLQTLQPPTKHEIEQVRIVWPLQKKKVLMAFKSTWTSRSEGSEEFPSRSDDVIMWRQQKLQKQKMLTLANYT